MKQLMTGNEAVARGAYEAGVTFASAYPGTPSTEIMANLANYDEIYSEWATNEKVALESAIGASIAGARSISSMKHVGLNVAADPLFTFAYSGVNGGNVVVTADEPGQFSSQNEQDNRNYAKMAKVPMFEPSDSQESKEMLKEAFIVSEQFDTPVLFRMTTRVCHSKSIVDIEDREDVETKEYIKDAKKYVSVPANARVWRRNLDARLKLLQDYSENSAFNYSEINNSKTGVITSGVSYSYAKEVFGDTVSYLKLGFTFPLPTEKIKEFCENLDTIYVIEENDSYIEEAVRILGFDCLGNNFFPPFGEMVPDVIRLAVSGNDKDLIKVDPKEVISREPTFCAGCPHRGFFYELSKKKNVMIAGDIGCYTLAFSRPYNAMDTALCMGGSFSTGHGAQTVFNMGQTQKRVVAVLGDSTFFHTGINSLINTIYNGSNTISVILDNRITGMTGHQENPGTGLTVKGEPAEMIDIESVVRSLGMKHIRVINPNDLKSVSDTVDELLELDEPSVIITRWPCVLKKLSATDKAEFENVFESKCSVENEKCIGCKICIKTGCPALSYNDEVKIASIDKSSCVGCEVCVQVCPKQAIKKEEK